MSTSTIQTAKIPHLPKRPKNSEVRSREYLFAEEVEKLISSCGGRHAERDALMIHVVFRHGLRVSELTELDWDQIDLKLGRIHVKRLKNGEDSTQALSRDELVGFRKLFKSKASRFVFTSQRGCPISVDSFQRIVKQAGKAAGISFPVHPHMLRHARGFDLANKGADTRVLQQLLGHKNIRHTVTYTKLTDKRVLELSKL